MATYSVLYHPVGKKVLSLISVSATVYNQCFYSVLTQRIGLENKVWLTNVSVKVANHCLHADLTGRKSSIAEGA